MKSILVLEIEHSKPLAEHFPMLASQRVYPLDGVEDAQVISFSAKLNDGVQKKAD